jgi:hypothetical protein
LVPAIASAIPGLPFAAVKIAFALVTLIVAFLERDLEMVNGKVWLFFLAVILLIMGLLPFFPDPMNAITGVGDFLNSLKIVLGAITFLLIVIDWNRL